MIIRCHVCGADPLGRWKQPPAIIFHGTSTGEWRQGARDDTVYAYRDHLSAKQEEEIQRREKGHWKKGRTAMNDALWDSPPIFLPGARHGGLRAWS